MRTTLAIRREDKNRWERRTPLVPADVRRLVDEGLRVLVEPSDLRIYDDASYRAAGAELTDDLSPADVVFAVKEIPAERIHPDKTYAFFAHVIKGQEHNMPLLRHLLDQRATLVDYELITDDRGRRLVLFGREAGQAGMIDALALLGKRWAHEGLDTPLTELDAAYTYSDRAAAEAHLDTIAATWRRQPPQLDAAAPFVVAIAGRGNAGQGAEQILDRLPVEEIAPADLPTLATRAAGVTDRIFKVVLRREHLFRPTAGGAYDAAEYSQHPDRYTGALVDLLPHITVLMSCIFWAPEYPRLFTRADARQLWQSGARKLRLIGDVTCDIDGAFETTYRATSPDAPAYVFDPEHDTFRDDVDASGILILAVDNLPCELPRDASDQFSRALSPFVPALVRADYQQPYEALGLPAEVQRALITHRGDLAPDHAHLAQAMADALG
ncbi:MAG: hypothetical protein AAGD38_13185 [Acidobacteriota bacterium]